MEQNEISTPKFEQSSHDENLLNNHLDKNSSVSDYSKNSNDEKQNKKLLANDKGESEEGEESIERNRKLSRSRSSSRKNSLDFPMKNGCCKNCMKAFNKNGKACLCQVPFGERKFTLPEKGCNFCGCHGCNPLDIKRQKRENLKKQLKEDKSIGYKNQRILDSDDEDLKINEKKVDDWNKRKKDLLYYLQTTLECDPILLGFGAPIRSPGYILGYTPIKGDLYSYPKPKHRGQHKFFKNIRKNSSGKAEKDNSD